MKTVKTTIWDPVEYLETAEDIAVYLEDAFSTNDPQLIITAIGDVARARGMTRVSEETACSRESLYKSLSNGGNPSFETVLKVMLSLGYGIKPFNVSINI